MIFNDFETILVFLIVLTGTLDVKYHPSRGLTDVNRVAFILQPMLHVYSIEVWIFLRGPRDRYVPPQVGRCGLEIPEEEALLLQCDHAILDGNAYDRKSGLLRPCGHDRGDGHVVRWFLAIDFRLQRQPQIFWFRYFSQFVTAKNTN